MTAETRRFIVSLALKLQGVPYLWGGSSPQSGFDCSGFALWVLQVFGVLPSGDWSAQGLHGTFPATGDPLPGDLVFYGKDPEHITHVMMFMGDLPGQGKMVIGASGGDSTTTTIEEAQKKGAQVKIKPMDYRSDRKAIGSIG